MGSSNKTFGEYFKELRIASGITLRRFCLDNGFDASNLSKMERGLLPPPPHESLEKYARCLHIKQGSKEWYELFDLAASTRGEIPPDILSDEKLVARLPLVFRTVRGEKVPEEQMDDLIKLILES
jgi:transcriptional regulator with XRE-family HTH domain